MAAARAIGGLMSRIQRQLNTSVRTPPSRTPAAPPTPFIAPHRPIARWRAGPAANEDVMIASELAAMSAPPKPWNPRATISVFLSGASPPARDATAKTARAATNTRRCPKWSAARPPSMRKPANVIAYALTIHWRSLGEKPRLDWMDGSATLTMLRSRMTMNCATQQTTRIHPVRERRPLFAGSVVERAGAAGRAFVSVKDRLQTAGKRYRTRPALFPVVNLLP